MELHVRSEQKSIHAGEKVKKIIRCALVLVLAGVVALALVMFNPKPEKRLPEKKGLLVEVVEARASSPAMIIRSYGTVRPSECVNLVSEVKGKIVEMDPGFEEGGFFTKGELLIRIDPRSYELAAAQREKQIKQLDAELRRIEQEKKNLAITLKIAGTDAELAMSDWERFKSLSLRGVVGRSKLDQAEQKYLASRTRMQEIENRIALIGPRSDQLQAEKELAGIRLEEALLDLDRTKIKAPFEGWILEKSVEKEEFVNTGTRLGSIYSASSLEIEARIPFKELPWLAELEKTGNPGSAQNKTVAGTSGRAKVIFNSGGRTRQWEGSLVRIKAEVDEKTRTLPVIVEVPCEGSGGQAGSIGILRPGMFVTVEIEGKRIDSAYLLPRSAIHPGDIVYIAEKNRLAIRKVEVLRRLNDSIYAGKGLKQGDMVIITPISSPKEGMELRVRPEETKGQR